MHLTTRRDPHRTRVSKPRGSRRLGAKDGTVMAAAIACIGLGASVPQDATQSATVTPRVRADFAVAQVLAGHSAQAEATLQADLSADEARASVVALAGLLPPGADKK